MGTSTWLRAELARPAARAKGGLRLGVGAAGLVVLAALTLAFVNSPVFHAREIRVRGEAHLSSVEVVRLSGLTPETNVLWLDTGEVERRLESSPWIREATVERSLPGEVRIAIVERRPVAVTAQGSALRLVAGDGTILGTVDRDPGLPLIVMGPLTTDGVVELAAPAGALAPMDAGLLAQVEKVTVSPGGSLQLELANGAVVLYGAPTEAARKALALRAVLRWAGAQISPLAVVDLRSPSAPTARLGAPA